MRANTLVPIYGFMYWNEQYKGQGCIAQFYLFKRNRDKQLEIERAAGFSVQCFEVNLPRRGE